MARSSPLLKWIRAGADAIGWPSRRSQARREAKSNIRREVARIVGNIRAKYDAAQTTDENRKHWALADSLSVNSANSAWVRKILRERARYERDNNSYCQGICSTLAADMIGTGPRLQLMTASEEANKFIQREFGWWADAIDLGGKLTLADMARHVDGEGFMTLATNPKLSTDVQLDLVDFECDQVTTPNFTGLERYAVDGIRFDPFRNPREYDILPVHPGDTAAPYNQVPVATPAERVLHWFTPTRPGQARGIPTLTPSIPLFAQLRRYSLAVLMAAEIAAELAAFVQSNMAPSEEGDGPEDFELLEVVRGQIMTLPQGWQISQLNPTQPTTGFAEFVNTILREIARCLNMPWGLAAGDSSQYNYASGRLDVQVYQRMIKVTRARLERKILDRILGAWLDEALLIPGYLPVSGLPPYAKWQWVWHWDNFEHVDPTKEANALQTLLSISATTLEQIYSAKGQDWLEALQQLAKEKQALEQLGLATSPAPPMPTPEPSPATETADNAVPA